MKTDVFKIVAIMLMLVGCFSCHENEPEEPTPPPEEPVVGIITMTTKATEVGFYLQMKPGTDSIVIDWGDGEGSKTYAPDGSDSYIGSYSFYYLNVSHSYSGASEHNINIVSDSIMYLNCGLNQLTTLDVSCNMALEELWCGGNQLTALDISSNTTLRILFCAFNQLTTLDVSHNTALKRLECSSNQLTTLNISSNVPLSWLYCDDNQLAAPALNDIFSSMCPHSRTKLGPIDHPYWIYIGDNPGTDNCNVGIAQAKGWHVEPPEISYTPPALPPHLQ